MTDDSAGESDGYCEELVPGITLEYEPNPGGKLRLAVYHQDTPIHSGIYNNKILGSDTLNGQFTNKVADSLDNRKGVDADAVTVELVKWFAEMNELDEEERANILLTNEVQTIIDGTHYPVEVYGGETTTWHITLTFEGITRELKFTASEMVSGGGRVLQEKIANGHFEVVKIEEEDWEAIRDHWQENKEVVSYVDESSEDTIADRVLEYLGHNVTPVDGKKKLANSPGAAWFDETNEAGSSAVPVNESVIWVQNTFLVDQIEAAGKSPEFKSQLIKTLNSRDDIHDIEADGRKRWPNNQGKERAKFYPFKPEALGISAEDVGGVDDPAHWEVDA